MDIDDNIIIEFIHVYCYLFTKYSKQSKSQQDYYPRWIGDVENYKFNSTRASWKFWLEDKTIRLSSKFC